MIREIIQVTKPGIIFGNLIAAAGGFFLASRGSIDYFLLVVILSGVSFIIASACVLNNYLDRDIDCLMRRTEGRYFVNHQITGKWIVFYTIVPGLTGFLILYWGANSISAMLGLIGFFAYIVLYTLFLKRKSPLGTIAGSLSGATPPVIGYCSVASTWDFGATLLFLLFCLWQMPHHYAIGIFRLKDYQSASIPVLPVVVGIPKTFRTSSLYIVAFWLTSSSFYWMGYTGDYYLVVTTAINVWWFYTSVSEFESIRKARRLFIQSVWVITLHCLLMGIPLHLSIW